MARVRRRWVVEAHLVAAGAGLGQRWVAEADLAVRAAGDGVGGRRGGKGDRVGGSAGACLEGEEALERKKRRRRCGAVAEDGRKKVKDGDTTPPGVSNTNQPINYAPPLETRYIGRNAPSLQDVATGRSTKRKAKSTKMHAGKKLAKGVSSSDQPADPAATTRLLVMALQVSPAQTSSALVSWAPPLANPWATSITLKVNIPLDSPKPVAPMSASTPIISVPLIAPMTEPPAESSSSLPLDPPLPQSLQAQDTPDNSLFSYQIGDLLEEEEISSKVVVLGEVPDEVKEKLQEILQLLYQDIGSLVQDAEGVRGVFRLLKGQLPADVEATLLPVAFIEGYQLKVLQAMQRLFDRATQAEQITQKEASRSRANDIKAWIELLENSRPTIVGEIDRLKARRAVLRKELEAVTLSL
ncbi:hypothetical protein C2845_PM18G04450 [Panicum miliaceum]|uniref:DUF1409 domain-containing protein n=1 Tax=Panicum miliaceum TaxID=4540 RepID=A0A3L6PGM7_PANMI|nr:hypothetical protein C2845_PM18G04450 [Panicum miliaceum]